MSSNFGRSMKFDYTLARKDNTQKKHEILLYVEDSHTPVGILRP